MRSIKWKKIDCQDLAFRNIVNGVFHFDPSAQEYDRKYIFFEESFFADGSEVNDVELIGKAIKESWKREYDGKNSSKKPDESV